MCLRSSPKGKRCEVLLHPEPWRCGPVPAAVGTPTPDPRPTTPSHCDGNSVPVVSLRSPWQEATPVYKGHTLVPRTREGIRGNHQPDDGTYGTRQYWLLGWRGRWVCTTRGRDWKRQGASPAFPKL